PARGGVLVHVVRGKLCHVHGCSPDGPEGGDVFRRERPALAEQSMPVRPGDVVTEEFAGGVVEGNRAEFQT
ncbi:MAG: hypothetical protein HW418_984, partial [Anaerolineales bacterium]|nr:hypothetical protein [Anaerolineales bacterium]